MVATQYIYGLGQGPTPVITPGVISTLSTGELGSVRSEGVAADSAGNIYFTDGPNNRIVKDAAGTFTPFPITGAALNNPKGIVADGMGNFYVSDSGNNRILKIASDGTATELDIAGLSAPSGLAIDAARTLYIADTGNARILMYALDGTTSTKAITPILISPTSLTFADDGTLYIADPGTSSIVKMTSAGVSAPMTITGAAISSPAGLATDRAGNLYVADSSANVVYRINADGSALAVAGNGTAGNSGDGGIATGAAISAPKAVLVGSSGSIYLSDSANGTIRQIAGSPTVSFPDTPVDSTNSQTVLFSNIGNSALTFPASFDFAQSPSKFSLINSGNADCSTLLGSSLAPAATCAIEGQFAPTAVGLASDTVALTGGLQITFSGNGIAGSAISSVNTNSLSFGTQAVSTTSIGQSITLSNTGAGTLNIGTPSLAGVNWTDFAITNNCGSTLAANASCTIAVTFTPGSPAAKTATLIITASDAVSSAALNQTVSLSGIGVGTGRATIRNTLINFGNVASGSTSTAQTVTIMNSGTGLLNINSVVVSGANAADFATINNCGAALAAGAQCTVSVTFHPSTMAAESAILAVTTADATTLAPAVSTVSVCGTGVAAAVGVVAVNTAPIDFGNVAIGSASTSETVAIANSGTGTLNMTSVAVSGPNAANFVLVNNCSETLLPSTNCTVTVTFHPSVAGLRTATLNITDADAITQTPLTQVISLRGTGVVLSGQSRLSVSTLTFPSQAAGTSGTAQTITLTNTGNATLAVNSVGLTGANANDFNLTNDCGAGLVVDQSCTVQVIFSPTLPGNKTANLVFSVGSGQSASTPTVTLMGIGSAAVATVPTGFIKITSVNSGRVLDVSNRSTLNGAPLQQYDYLGGLNQQWQAVAVDSTYYKIVSLATGKVLDVTGSSLRDGTFIQQWNYQGGDNQKWQFIPQSDGSFEIVNKLSGKALDVLSVSQSNHARIQQWTYNATDNQKWRLETVNVPTPTEQYYTISSLSTGKVLDVSYMSTADAALIQQYDYLRGANQEWKLIPTTNGFYRIENHLSGKVLDARNAGTANGTAVQQYTYLGGDNQQWRMVPTANGYYQIVNKLSGKSLDIIGVSSANAAGVQTYTYLGGSNQQFQITPVY